MQYYTRQQLQGSLRYKESTLLGNWNEDRCMKETVLKDFLAKADTGNLKIDHFQANMERALAPQELTVVRSDGYVHFGDILQLQAVCSTGAVLAVDTHDTDRRTGEHACAATAAPQVTQPCARNTLLLTKYTSPRLDISTTHYDDDVLRYGQKIRIAAHAAVQGEAIDSAGGKAPLCLFSKPVVGFTTCRDYDTVFTVVPPNPADRIASEGVEVCAGAPICLQHCATSALLCLEPHAHANDFGAERELSCHTSTGTGKKLLLVHETRGELTATIPSARVEANQFRFVVGTTENTLPPPEQPATPGADAALARVRAAAAATAAGVRGLREKLLRLDASGHGKLQVAEVQLAFAWVGAPLDTADVALLAQRYATAQPHTLDVRALLADLEASD